MLKLFKYLRGREWLQIAGSLVFIVAQVWLDLKLPDYMAQITTLINTPGSTSAQIWAAGGSMLLCALGSLAGAVIVGFFAARIAAAFSRRLRSRLFNKVDSFSMEEINRFSTASLITRSTNDITQIQLVVTLGLQIVVKAPILAVWAIIKIAGKGLEWTMVTGIVIAILLLMLGLVFIFVTPKFKKMQQLTDNLNRVTRENLTGLRVVRAYNAEDYQQGKFAAANTELTDTNLFTSRAMALMMPMMNALMSGLNLAIFWLGAFLISAAAVADKLALFSNMVVFSSYAMQVVMAFMMMAMIFMFLPRALVSAKRVNEVLNTEPTIHPGTVSEGLPGMKGEISFRHVSFKYPDAAEYVLKDISFDAHQGETVAFIGSTGSGKSSLINLVPRFFDATEGEVLLDGINVRDYSEQALHNKLGYVPQKAVLFHGTVGSNVTYGDNGSDSYDERQISQAIAIAQGADFVSGMEGGLDAAVAQGGANLSGGQKQRLAIARAVCRAPEVYIFDDSFSALDYQTDRRLRSQLRQETAGVTSLIVAQRIGTILDADRIIVLHEGKIAGQGTHRQLMQSCAVYQQIAASQLSEEELAI